MTCSEWVLVIIGGVAIILQLIAVYLFLRAIKETRKTTKEVNETTSALRDVQESINKQSQAMYVSQLWLKWSSPEIRYSHNFSERLIRHDARTVWKNAYNSNRELADRGLEIPRFFDDLVGRLINIGSIRLQTAIENFGLFAYIYWDKFESLITALREDLPGSFGLFIHFETFAEAAKKYHKTLEE